VQGWVNNLTAIWHAAAFASRKLLQQYGSLFGTGNGILQKAASEYCYTLTPPDTCKADFIDSTLLGVSANRMFSSNATHTIAKNRFRFAGSLAMKRQLLSYSNTTLYYVTHNI